MELKIAGFDPVGKIQYLLFLFFPMRPSLAGLSSVSPPVLQGWQRGNTKKPRKWRTSWRSESPRARLPLSRESDNSQTSLELFSWQIRNVLRSRTSWDTESYNIVHFSITLYIILLLVERPISSIIQLKQDRWHQQLYVEILLFAFLYFYSRQCLIIIVTISIFS